VVVADCVIFDLFHTLVHGGNPERDRVVAEMGAIVRVEPAALVRAYNDTWRDRLTRWDAEETVRILADRLGGSPTDEEVARAVELRRALATRVLGAVRPATLDVLAALRAGDRRLGLISNATAETAEAWPDSPLAPHLDTAVFSCQIGQAKPDPEIYRAAADRLGTTPDACVFVGDGADGELAGAAAVGMTVIRTTEYGDSDPTWLGLTIASLADLPALLATLRIGPAGGIGPAGRVSPTDPPGTLVT
jgi:putative hydrolase of the HAD superfamily